MQWFKHMTNMRHDPKIKRLINKYGLEGYGLYCLILESIIENLTSKSPIPDLEETCEDIASFYNSDTTRINEIACFMVNQGLLEIDELTTRIICHKIYKFLDQSMTNSKELRKMIDDYKKSQVTSSNVMTSHERIEKKRIEKNRIEKNNIYIDVLSYWNDKKIITHKNDIFLNKILSSNNNILKKYKDIINLYSLQEIKKSIDNYTKCLQEDKYYWSHKWSLWDFLTRGIDKFIDTAEPLKNYLSNKNKNQNNKKSKYTDEDFKVVI